MGKKITSVLILEGTMQFFLAKKFPYSRIVRDDTSMPLYFPEKVSSSVLENRTFN